MKYRSRTEIVTQILEATSQAATKTKIMYRAFLSHAQLKEYLTALEFNELIVYDEKNQLYRTTDKGFRFLKLYYQIDKLTSSKKDELAT
jgi:predicted transcriptional regulator